MWMSTETFDIHKTFEYHPNELGLDGEFVKIDEEIAPIISMLNKKQYYTEFCCAGHLHHIESDIHETLYRDNMYIMFKHNVDFSELVETSDWYQDDDEHNCIRCWVQADDPYEFFKKRYECHEKLYNYVMKLPKRKKYKGW